MRLFIDESTIRKTEAQAVRGIPETIAPARARSCVRAAPLVAIPTTLWRAVECRMNASSMRRSNSIGYAYAISRTAVCVSNARRRSGTEAHNVRWLWP
jgi:hypothetical protein